MTRFTLTFQITDAEEAQVTALRDECAEWLTERGVKVTTQSMSRETQCFRVRGVDKDSKPFDERVEAENEEAAKTEAETKGRVVAAVDPMP